MNATRYAFCVASLRALEGRLLTKEDITTLTGCKELTAALNFLVQKGYACENEDINDIASRHTKELNRTLFESVPDKKELDTLYILNDYFNLKVLVKSLIEKNDAAELFAYPTTIDPSVLNSASAENVFSLLKVSYAEAAGQAYSIALKSRNGKFSDAVIDTAAVNALTAYAATKNSGILGRICAFTADTANMKTALRCAFTGQDEDFIKEAIGDCTELDKVKLISSASTGTDELISYLEGSAYAKGLEIYLSSPSAFEKWCDDNIIAITSESVYTSFGFDPAVSYFYRKSLEIKTVRMILTAIKSGIDKNIIKERLRELYA